MRPWSPGETVVHQEVWRGRLWAVRPLTVVADHGELLQLWLPAGTRRKIPITARLRHDPASLDERIMQNLSAGDWDYADHVWDFSNLWLLRPGDWHAVWVGWTDGTHRGWYVNFQEPFSRTAAVSRQWI